MLKVAAEGVDRCACTGLHKLAYFYFVAILVGRRLSGKAVDVWGAVFPLFVLSRLVHMLNALLPTVVTFLGMVMELMPDAAKAYCPIYFNDLGRVTDSNDGHAPNAP